MEFAPIMTGTPSVQTPTSLLQVNAVFQKNQSTLKNHRLPLLLFPKIGRKEIPH